MNQCVENLPIKARWLESKIEEDYTSYLGNAMLLLQALHDIKIAETEGRYLQAEGLQIIVRNISLQRQNLKPEQISGGFKWQEEANLKFDDAPLLHMEKQAKLKGSVMVRNVKLTPEGFMQDNNKLVPFPEDFSVLKPEEQKSLLWSTQNSNAVSRIIFCRHPKNQVQFQSHLRMTAKGQYNIDKPTAVYFEQFALSQRFKNMMIIRKIQGSKWKSRLFQKFPSLYNALVFKEISYRLQKQFSLYQMHKQYEKIREVDLLKTLDSVELFGFLQQVKKRSQFNYDLSKTEQRRKQHELKRQLDRKMHQRQKFDMITKSVLFTKPQDDVMSHYIGEMFEKWLKLSQEEYEKFMKEFQQEQNFEEEDTGKQREIHLQIRMIQLPPFIQLTSPAMKISFLKDPTDPLIDMRRVVRLHGKTEPNLLPDICFFQATSTMTLYEQTPLGNHFTIYDKQFFSKDVESNTIIDFTFQVYSPKDIIMIEIQDQIGVKEVVKELPKEEGKKGQRKKEQKKGDTAAPVMVQVPIYGTFLKCQVVIEDLYNQNNEYKKVMAALVYRSSFDQLKDLLVSQFEPTVQIEAYLKPSYVKSSHLEDYVNYFANHQMGMFLPSYQGIYYMYPDVKLVKRLFSHYHMRVKISKHDFTNHHFNYKVSQLYRKMFNNSAHNVSQNTHSMVYLLQLYKEYEHIEPLPEDCQHVFDRFTMYFNETFDVIDGQTVANIDSPLFITDIELGPLMKYLQNMELPKYHLPQYLPLLDIIEFISLKDMSITFRSCLWKCFLRYESYEGLFPIAKEPVATNADQLQQPEHTQQTEQSQEEAEKAPIPIIEQLKISAYNSTITSAVQQYIDFYCSKYKLSENFILQDKFFTEFNEKVSMMHRILQILNDRNLVKSITFYHVAILDKLMDMYPGAENRDEALVMLLSIIREIMPFLIDENEPSSTLTIQTIMLIARVYMQDDQTLAEVLNHFYMTNAPFELIFYELVSSLFSLGVPAEFTYAVWTYMFFVNYMDRIKHVHGAFPSVVLVLAATVITICEFASPLLKLARSPLQLQQTLDLYLVLDFDVHVFMGRVQDVVLKLRSSQQRIQGAITKLQQDLNQSTTANYRVQQLKKLASALPQGFSCNDIERMLVELGYQRNQQSDISEPTSPDLMKRESSPAKGKPVPKRSEGSMEMLKMYHLCQIPSQQELIEHMRNVSPFVKEQMSPQQLYILIRKVWLQCPSLSNVYLKLIYGSQQTEPCKIEYAQFLSLEKGYLFKFQPQEIFIEVQILMMTTKGPADFSINASKQIVSTQQQRFEVIKSLKITVISQPVNEACCHRCSFDDIHHINRRDHKISQADVSTLNGFDATYSESVQNLALERLFEVDLDQIDVCRRINRACEQYNTDIEGMYHQFPDVRFFGLKTHRDDWMSRAMVTQSVFQQFVKHFLGKDVNLYQYYTNPDGKAYLIETILQAIILAPGTQGRKAQLIFETLQIYENSYSHLTNQILKQTARSFIFWIYECFYGLLWAQFSEEIFQQMIFDHSGGNIRKARLFVKPRKLICDLSEEVRELTNIQYLFFSRSKLLTLPIEWLEFMLASQDPSIELSDCYLEITTYQKFTFMFTENDLLPVVFSSYNPNERISAPNFIKNLVNMPGIERILQNPVMEDRPVKITGRILNINLVISIFNQSKMFRSQNSIISDHKQVILKYKQFNYTPEYQQFYKGKKEEDFLSVQLRLTIEVPDAQVQMSLYILLLQIETMIVERIIAEALQGFIPPQFLQLSFDTARFKFVSANTSIAEGQMGYLSLIDVIKMKEEMQLVYDSVTPIEKGAESRYKTIVPLNSFYTSIAQMHYCDSHKIWQRCRVNNAVFNKNGPTKIGIHFKEQALANSFVPVEDLVILDQIDLNEIQKVEKPWKAITKK